MTTDTGRFNGLVEQAPSPDGLGHSATIPSAEALLARIKDGELAVAKCQLALEREESILADLHIAFRVIFGASPERRVRPSGNRQLAIISLLKEGRQHAQTPAMLFRSYWELGLEQITIETFRTTLWRMAQMYRFPDWIVRSDERGYWKVPAQGIAAGTDETASQAQPEGQEPGPKDAPRSQP